jgi:hypothetical protein
MARRKNRPGQGRKRIYEELMTARTIYLTEEGNQFLRELAQRLGYDLDDRDSLSRALRWLIEEYGRGQPIELDLSRRSRDETIRRSFRFTDEQLEIAAGAGEGSYVKGVRGILRAVLSGRFVVLLSSDVVVEEPDNELSTNPD